MTAKKRYRNFLAKFLFLVLVVLVCFRLMPNSPLRIPLARAAVIEGSFTIHPCNDTLTSLYSPSSQPWFDDESLQLGINDEVVDNRYGWFKFNMTEEFRGALTITAARLYGYVNNIDFGNGTTMLCYSLDPANEGWIDDVITWNTQPYLLPYAESSDEPWINATDSWYEWDLNTTSLQTSYDANDTRTYILRADNSTYNFAMSQWNSTDNTSNRPKLTVWYQLYSDEETEETPTISDPNYYVLTFYPIEDSMVNSANVTANYGTQNISQAKFSESTGIEMQHIFKYNMSYPDLIDGTPNTINFTLLGTPFDIIFIRAYQFCQFAPPEVETGTDWRGYNVMYGVSRSDESWDENTTTWNTKPESRAIPISLTNFITEEEYYWYSLITDEDFIRYSVNNETTYSIYHIVDSRKDIEAFADWRMREYDDDNLTIPFIHMQVAIGEIEALIPGYLTWTTAHIYLGNALMLPSFIAGYLLSGMIYAVFIIPITWISRKLILASMLALGLTSMFYLFGWIDIGFVGLMILIWALTIGGRIKKWIS